MMKTYQVAIKAKLQDQYRFRRLAEEVAAKLEAWPVASRGSSGWQDMIRDYNLFSRYLYDLEAQLPKMPGNNHKGKLPLDKEE